MTALLSADLLGVLPVQHPAVAEYAIDCAILKTMSMSCSMKTTVIFCASTEFADLVDHPPALLGPHARGRLIEQQHLGSSTSASAISSSFWSPCDNVAAMLSRLSARPSNSASPLGAVAAFRPAESAGAACGAALIRTHFAASMVSCTVSEGKILATWNARPMPWRDDLGRRTTGRYHRRRAGSAASPAAAPR